MLDQGFLKEVENLQNSYNTLNNNLPSMRSVGYRQALAYLSGDYSYAEFIDKAIAATRQLAKRQLTWLRNWKGQIEYIDPVKNDINISVERYIKSFIC